MLVTVTVVYGKEKCCFDINSNIDYGYGYEFLYMIGIIEIFVLMFANHLFVYLSIFKLHCVFLASNIKNLCTVLSNLIVLYLNIST